MLRNSARFTAAMAVAALLAGGAVALNAGVASATPTTTLTNVSWSVSNNATSSTGANNTATYTWDFTTGTLLATGATSLSQLTFSVPSETATSTLAITGTPYGLLGCAPGAPSLASTTVTVTLTGCSTIPSGTPIYISIRGFINPTTASATPGTGTVSTVTTYKGAGHTAVEAGTSNPVTFQSNKTTVNVVVPESLTFTNLGPAAITLLPVPGVPAVASAATAVNLRVSTNAVHGYDLSGCLQHPLKKTGTATTPPINTITSAVNSAKHPLPGEAGPSAFAARVTKATTATTAPGGAGFALNGTWAATATQTTTYLGYASSCATTHTTTPTSTNKIISKDSGPTLGDQIALTNGVGVSATQAAGHYSGTINYTVLPRFT